MQIEISIITSDYEFGFDLLETCRFPERRPVIVPGEAVISSQRLRTDVDNLPEGVEIVDLVVDINEDTSVSTFAGWFYGKLKVKTEKIHSLTIAGKEIKIDEAEIARAIEEGE